MSDQWLVKPRTAERLRGASVIVMQNSKHRIEFTSKQLHECFRFQFYTTLPALTALNPFNA